MSRLRALLFSGSSFATLVSAPFPSSFQVPSIRTTIRFIAHLPGPQLPTGPVEARSRSRSAASFDQLVGAGEQRGRHGEPESAGGLQVDGKLEFGWSLDGKVGWLGALKDAIHVRGRAPEDIGGIWSVTHQHAFGGGLSQRANRRQPMGFSRSHDDVPVDDGEWVRCDDQTAIGRTPEPRTGRFDLSRVVDGNCRDLDRQTRRNGSKFAEVNMKIRSEVRIEHEAGPNNARCDLLEQLQPFADHFKIDKGKPSNVAARMCQARDEGLAHWIVNHHEDDGYSSGGLLQRGGDWSAMSDDQIGRQGH